MVMSVEEALVQYEPMIHHLLKSAHTNAVCGYEDLVQEGRIAIMKAYESYNPEKGSLTTWVYWMLKCVLAEYQKRHLSILSGGQYLHEILKKASENASKEEIMSFGVKEKTAQQAITLRNSYNTAQIDSVSNFVGSYDVEYQSVESLPWREFLDPTETYIVSCKCGYDGPVKSEDEIGAELGMPPKSVRRRFEQALVKLRHIPDIEDWAID